MFRRLIFYMIVCFSGVKRNFSITDLTDCHGGFYINDFDHPCNCSLVSRTGRYCSDELRSGVIFVPGGKNARFTLERESRNAKFINQTKDGVILYNAATDTVIVIVNKIEFKTAVHFDSQVVELICSKQSIFDNLIKNLYQIECTDNEDNRVHSTCSKRSSARIVTVDEKFIKIISHLNQGMWNERCSMRPNTHNVMQQVFLQNVTGKPPVFDCHGGFLIYDHFDHVCNCSLVSRTGTFCSDELLPGLILVPAGENARIASERESRNAKFIKQTKEEVILYNATTDTVIVIVDKIKFKRAVHFDSQVVQFICSMQSHPRNFLKIFITFLNHIKCTDDWNNRVYTTCSKLSSAGNVNADLKFIKILAYLNQQMWDERCSMSPNTHNVIQQVSLQNVADETAENGKTTPVEFREKYLLSKSLVFIVMGFFMVVLISFVIVLFLLNKRYSFIPNIEETCSNRKNKPLKHVAQRLNFENCRNSETLIHEVHHKRNECDAQSDYMMPIFDMREKDLVDVKDNQNH